MRNFSQLMAVGLFVLGLSVPAVSSAQSINELLRSKGEQLLKGETTGRLDQAQQAKRVLDKGTDVFRQESRYRRDSDHGQSENRYSRNRDSFDGGRERADRDYRRDESRERRDYSREEARERQSRERDEKREAQERKREEDRYKREERNESRDRKRDEDRERRERSRESRDKNRYEHRN